MRGEDRTSGALFCYVDVEARIGANHPLRAMRRLTNAALAELDPRFSALYEGIGRPSIAPERLLRASLLQLLYSIRSERQLVERLEFDMLFRWFVGLTIDEKVFDASTFSKNRDRLLTHAIAQEFLSSLLGLPEVKGLLSAEHFSVDGTLLKAWASMKSFRPKSASGEAKSRLRLACNKSISSGRRLSNPRLYASLSSSVSLALAIRARSGAGLSTLAACACHSRRALKIWLGASLRWREVRRAILCPAGRSLRSLRLRSPQRHSGRTALRSITRRYRFCPDRFAGQKTVSRSCDAHAAAVRNVRFTSTPAGRNAQTATFRQSVANGQIYQEQTQARCAGKSHPA